MNIVIYGGSFNPPHIGHVEAARTVAEALAPERLLIIPDRIPPHKELDELSPSPEERLELCRLAFAEIPGAEVSDMELLREGKSYTYHTVSELCEQYPDDALYLVVGTDMLKSFEDWYHFRYLLEHCTLLALRRADSDEAELERAAEHLRTAYGAKVEILLHEPMEISSTELRERLRMRLGAEDMPQAEYAHIIRLRQYGAKPELSWLREQVDNYLAPERIAHVRGCESEAVMLAKRWGEDEELAAEAGILHDITKRCTLEEQLKLCEKYGIMIDNSLLEAPALLHAKTGAAMARELFGVDDTVYDAIYWHTTGRADMSLFEKILYLADYIEPSRDFEGIDKLRDLAYEDIDEAMALGLQMTIEDLERRGKAVDASTLETLQWYQKKER